MMNQKDGLLENFTHSSSNAKKVYTKLSVYQGSINRQLVLIWLEADRVWFVDPGQTLPQLNHQFNHE